MFKISKRLDYSISLTCFLAKINLQVSARKLCMRFNFLYSLVHNLLIILVKNKILKSTRGHVGVYALAKPVSSITFNHHIEAIEGPIFSTNCLKSNNLCVAYILCVVKRTLLFLQGQILKLFQFLTLTDMINVDANWYYFIDQSLNNQNHLI